MSILSTRFYKSTTAGTMAGGPKDFGGTKELVQLFGPPKAGTEVNISPEISISAQPLKMALHRNPAMHGSRMVIFLHDSKKALFKHD